MAGTFATLGLTLRALSKAAPGAKADLRPPKIALWVTVVLTVAVYTLYLLFGESWVWYLR